MHGSLVQSTTSRVLLLLLALTFTDSLLVAQQAQFDKGPDTQAESIPLLTDPQAQQAWSLPDGLQIQIFASAPMISQPIAATFDRHQRLWLAENYTYSERPNIFQRDKSDRILVLQDTDHDGVADESRVFWDEGKLLSSVEVGMGGVWALCSPQLLFIPDPDEDGVADGPPQVILDGFEDQEVGHNMVNGLRWGPDGWLYGRHGIQATSYVGRPETPSEKRLALNCCIWRYHPVAGKFEVVCQGTTNSWGHDWTEDGELFFINTVIGHLWHAVPNTHFQRMYGEDLTPHTFQLIEQVADHVHWDQSNEPWQGVQKHLSGNTDAAGGGHAHSGMMIVQQPSWPAEWQGDVLTVNYHGTRINRDHLEKHGATFVGQHRPDLMKTTDPWFRGIDLIHAPADGMVILDWQDIGECHDNDGIHRSSGRIFLVNSRKQTHADPINLDELSAASLTNLLIGDDVFWRRQARIYAQNRFLGNQVQWDDETRSLHGRLRNLLSATLSNGDHLRALRSQWALQAIGGLSKNQLLELLNDARPEIRRWTIRLLSDQTTFAMPDGVPVPESESVDLWQPTLTNEIAAALLKRAELETDPLVLIYLASSMRSMPENARWEMAKRLSRHASLAQDRVFPLLVWYGLEPAVVAHAADLENWLKGSRVPLLDRFIARRLAIQYTLDPNALTTLLQVFPNVSASHQESLLQGLMEGWDGWSSLNRPAGWEVVAKSSKVDLEETLEQLENVFASDQPIDQLVQLLQDGNHSLVVRGNALRTLGRRLKQADISDEDRQRARETLLQYVPDRFLGVTATQALASSATEAAIEPLLERFPNLRSEVQDQIVRSCAEFPAGSLLLLEAIAEGKVDRSQVTPYVLRQMQLLGDTILEQRIQQLWPERGLLQKNQLQQIQAMRTQWEKTDWKTADLQAGRAVFQEQCSKCHRLFGEGATVGPDLTGAQRSNLTYWLQNIMAPSAEVGTGFRMSIVLLNDGRTLSGVITEKSPVSFRLVTQTDKILVRQSDVEAIRESKVSLMPDGLLDGLKESEIRDLLGYLMTPTRP